MQRTTIFLTEPQRNALATLTKMSGSPAAQHIRQAIDQYIASPTAQFLLKQADAQADRRARGAPYAGLDNIENTVFFRFLQPEQQAQIRLATTDDEKRALFAEFVGQTEQPAAARTDAQVDHVAA